MGLRRALLAAAGATLLLTALTGTAAAGRLSSSSQTFRATFREVRYTGGFQPPTCALTLEGSFHARTIVKTITTLVGSITRASLGSCTQGSADVLVITLPWHLQYSL